MEIKKTVVPTTSGPDIEVWELLSGGDDHEQLFWEEATEASQEYKMILTVVPRSDPEEYHWYYMGVEIGWYDDEKDL